MASPAAIMPGTHGKISKMVALCSNMMQEYDMRMSLMRDSIKIPNRKQAVKWIKDVSYSVPKSNAARDISIQILDKFLSRHLTVNSSIMTDTAFLSLASACCLLLGSKMNELKSPLTTESFPHFSSIELANFECFVLTTIDFSVVPQVTPASFVANLLKLWQPINFDTSPILITAENLVLDFIEEPSSLVYAPSTIAIAALLLSFLQLGIDCTPWLQCVPDSCLPTPTNPLYAQAVKENKSQFLDVDGCIQSFQVIITRAAADAASDSCKRKLSNITADAVTTVTIVGEEEDRADQNKRLLVSPSSIATDLDAVISSPVPVNNVKDAANASSYWAPHHEISVPPSSTFIFKNSPNAEDRDCIPRPSVFRPILEH